MENVNSIQNRINTAADNEIIAIVNGIKHHISQCPILGRVIVAEGGQQYNLAWWIFNSITFKEQIDNIKADLRNRIIERRTHELIEAAKKIDKKDLPF